MSLFLLTILILLVASPTVHAAAAVDQARKEGKVVLYTTMLLADFQVFQIEFRKKYPFLEIEYVRLGGESVVSRALLEHRAGQVKADVISAPAVGLNYLKGNGALKPHASEEKAGIREEFFDRDGHWYGISTDLLVTAVNPTLLPLNEAPKTYQDYLLPKYKGKMGIHNANAWPLFGMAQLLGEERGIAYIKRLAAQELIGARGYPAAAQLMAAGEFPIAVFMQATKAEEMRSKGAPVDWQQAGPTIAVVSGVGMTARVPHPAAAALLIDHYLSEAGQNSLLAVGKIPVRSVAGIHPRFKDVLQRKPMAVVGTQGDAERYTRIFLDIMSGKR
jgi:iron(III) transport system substrate-binding protein